MPVTPSRKLVHWDLDSPSYLADSSLVSTSSLEFINSQLVAHGFVSSPGLSLEGISNDDSERVVKCLLGLLSQRVEDMSRAEDLTTKLRNLSYDHERMLSMCRAANERAANAERETNLHKSRLTAAQRNLQASETAHKQTISELQRSRTTLQGIRAKHIADLKKKEKDTDLLMEKWQKLCDSQTKVSVTPIGMRCQNVAVANGSEMLEGKCQGYLEIALEEAEQARASLEDKTVHLRKLILSTVNEVQSILYQAQTLLPDNESLEAPSPFTLTTLFPLSPPTAASAKLSSVLSGLRQCVDNVVKVSQPSNKTLPSKPVQPVPEGELERLRDIITSLKEEIARSQKESITHATETQALFDKFAKSHRDPTGEIGEMSIELVSAPLRDEEKERLDSLRRELDSERQRFTETAIKFGRDKADLEAERLKFLEEKRSWQVEMMLADFPPTPVPVPTSPVRPAVISHKQSKSPRKSPAKRRSVSIPSKVKYSYETELIPPIADPPLQAVSLSSSLLPTTFVLPPPTPGASLPTKPALPPAVSDSLPETATSQTPSSTSSSTSNSASSSPEINLVPSTPPAVVHRPFPVAKPLVPRMIHAYSPAKPSPLSRILMLSDSPLSPPRNSAVSDDSFSPTSGPLAVVLEEADDDGGLGSIPLDNNIAINAAPTSSYGLGMGRVFHPDPNAKKPPTVQGKGKRKAKEDPIPRPHSSTEAEKENNSKPNQKVLVGKSGKISPAMSGGNIAAASRKISPTNEPGKAVTKSATKPTSTTSISTTTSRTKTFTKPPVTGGARRVLINSVDAPPTMRNKARKG